MTEPEKAEPGIQSYILRLWLEGEAESRVWRVSLVRLPNGQRIGFADLDSAFLFLREQTSLPNTSQH
jgi:hypothetical protein